MQLLTLLHSMILVLALLTPFTPSISVQLFNHFRIAQTRLMMLHVFHSPKTNTKLRSILQAAALHSDLWSGHTDAHPNFAQAFLNTRTTYLRFSHHTNFLPKFYVGSTEQNVLTREYNRYRKFLQIKSDRLVLCEVALRFWETFDNLFMWSPIPLRTDPANFRAYETALIQEWQPPLNFPFINQFYHPRKGLLRRAPLGQSTQFGHRRLWRQSRWSTTAAKIKQTLQGPTFRSRLKSWTMIHDLGSNTRRSYDTQRFLRSSAAGVNTCYALRRLAAQIQEPSRSIALNHLDNCITHWKGKKAPKPFSFRCPWLLTPNLSKTIRRALTTWYHQNHTVAVPFHKPSVKVIYQKHPAVGEFLFTHKKAVQGWASDNPPQCTCELLRQFPEAAIPNTQHIILDASKLVTQFSPVEQALLTGSMNNRFFPDEAHCQEKFLNNLHQWTQRNRLPTMPLHEKQRLFDQLWADHHPLVPTAMSASTIRHVQQRFPGCEFHCEDKKASSLRIFCPCLYYLAIENTFMDKKVFSQIDLHPEECVQAYVEDITKKFKTTHPWALGKGRKLPAGYILPKRKKNFESGRPIIGFVDAPFRPMLNIMAKLLYTLVPKACPNHFALGDMYTLLQLLHSCPMDAPLQLWNQDLAGFFISIETPRFLRAWSTLKYFLSKRMNTNDDQVFSVSPIKDNQPGDTIKGRTYRRLNVTRKIKVGEIPLIITTALNMRAFQLGTKTFQQDRGSPMGSPLSPALCLMVVSIEEQIWYSTYHQFLSSTAIWYKGLRYVDNRLLMGEPHLQYEPAFATLLDEHFYQAPIILEYEADQEFLGFQVETQPLEVIYNQPRDTSQILSPTSASPPHVLLSGFRSRYHIVVKCAFPHHQKIIGIHRLTETYERAGFEFQKLHKIAQSILHSLEKKTAALNTHIPELLLLNRFVL